MGSKHAYVVNATVAHAEPETCHVVILLINQAIEMKGLDHHLLCPMQHCVNGVVIDEVPKFLAPVPSETTHAKQIANPFDATHPIINPLKLNRVTSYFEVKKSTQEEYQDENILKVELMAKVAPWDLSSPEYSHQEQSTFHYRGQCVSPDTPSIGHFFINSITWYAYDATDGMDDDNYATVLESFVITTSL